MEIAIQLPDGSSMAVKKGETVGDVARRISNSLYKKAVAGMMDDKVVDLSTEVVHGGTVRILTLEDQEGLAVYRHSAAHLLAQAVKRLYPDGKLGIGPVIENGFYYDVDLPQSLTSADLPRIEQAMERIVQENHAIHRKLVTKEEALAIYEQVGDPYKVELIHELSADEPITLYVQGEFFDLCRGPHLPRTGMLKAFKLLSVAGAYWRGNTDHPMLQRVYGTIWPNSSQLKEHLQSLEEAKKRDHRKIGKEQELFMFAEEAPGMPFYLPKGMALRQQLESFVCRIFQESGYQEVQTPLMMNRKLWEASGHWEHYRENMYETTVDDTNFALKPMSCPGHMMIFKQKRRSYRDLPLRFAEFGHVHRHEYSGALQGLFRVRAFTQDDAHLFVRPDQVKEEVAQTMNLIDRIYSAFGFKWSVELSTRPVDSMGEENLWVEAENALTAVLRERGAAYRINEGDGAFYGPKIDFHIRDALGRSHQCATIQLDFQMPEKFDLTYIGEDNQRHRPIVIHRAVMGSIDRFLGILVEHYGGGFPLWLAPVQVKVLTLSDSDREQGTLVVHQLKAADIRVELDARQEKIGYKVREAQLQQVPYMLVIGKKEREQNGVSVRKRGIGEMGIDSLETVLSRIQEEIKERR
ncbi:threonine--tRNA ligase [Marininema halotolerans]|uniref:Threonine--tRNA ligase n=1 Tax=Marininema halotolerans TaxID=1155944 RepID=A0A1I6S5F8_9BACL|nr:threonine--tRNA ligase [Marininema halotolerans]SFS72166.1 threonyl-tRNA synthetase [Marininema halotolerans]